MLRGRHGRSSGPKRDPCFAGGMIDHPVKPINRTSLVKTIQPYKRLRGRATHLPEVPASAAVPSAGHPDRARVAGPGVRFAA
jgi:hypothetical protein